MRHTLQQAPWWDVTTALATAGVALLAACTGSIDAGGMKAAGGQAGVTAGTAGRAGSGAIAGQTAGTGGAASGGVVGCDIGETPLQRLTRSQYDHAIRDLLPGVKANIDLLTPDESVGPFKGNGVGSTTDLGTQQYQEVAESLARTAVGKLDALLGCDRKAMGDAACATQFIQRFGRRAYRRALSADELSNYQALYTQYAAKGGIANGVRLVVATMLQSPHFLYHLELGAAPVADGAVVDLAPFELASRLSFFLWDSGPDDALLDAAAEGRLVKDSELASQVTRMLADDRARDAMGWFHVQWMGLDKWGDVWKDSKVYPEYSGTLGRSMLAEPTAFVDWVMRKGDGRLDTLLTAPFTIADDVLLAHYKGTRAAGKTATDPVDLDPKQRAGLLTQAAFLTAHASVNQSSPVSRGVVVRKNLMCQDLPDPPANVNATPPEPRADATTRERFAEHEKSPSCGGCHKLIDGIGLGFENYDGIGRYRTTENGKPVDARGTITESRDIDGDFDGAVALAQKLAGSAEVSECVTRQWFRFGMGRLERSADACTIARLQTAFVGAKRDIRVLLGALAQSEAFRRRRLPP